MAVDTAQKRAALVAFASPFPFPALVPDSSIDDRDRAALAGLALPTIESGGGGGGSATWLSRVVGAREQMRALVLSVAVRRNRNNG